MLPEWETKSQVSDAWASTIERAQQLDPKAFDAIVDAWAPRLYGFVSRLSGSRRNAEELVQEVFLRVVSSIASYQHQGRFDAWLFQIARHVVLDAWRKQRREPVIESGDQLNTGCSSIRESDRQTEPAKLVEDSEALDQLQSCMNKLPDREREVVLLRHFGQLSYADIASLLEIPLGTALARAHRGLGKLRQWMESN